MSKAARGDEQRVLDRRLGARVVLARRGAVGMARVELGRLGGRRRRRRTGGGHIVGEHMAQPERRAALAERRERGGQRQVVVVGAARAGEVERAAAQQHAAWERPGDPRAPAGRVLGDRGRGAGERVRRWQRRGRPRPVRQHRARGRDGAVALSGGGQALEPVAERLDAREHEHEVRPSGGLGGRAQARGARVMRRPDDRGGSRGIAG